MLLQGPSEWALELARTQPGLVKRLESVHALLQRTNKQAMAATSKPASSRAPAPLKQRNPAGAGRPAPAGTVSSKGRIVAVPDLGGKCIECLKDLLIAVGQGA